MVQTEVPAHSGGPARIARHRCQGPDACYGANLTQALVGPHDDLGTDAEGTTDSLDRASDRKSVV